MKQNTTVNIPVDADKEENTLSLDHRNAAMTGCDTTFYFHGISKKSALKVYRNNYLKTINLQKSKRISEVSLLYVYQRETVQK